MKIIRKVFYAILLSLFFLPLYSFTPSKHELIPSGHWIYDAITALALEVGNVNFAQNAPLSIAELTLYLDDIDTSKLSSIGKKQIIKINDFFNKEYPAYGNEILSLGTDIVLSPEFLYRSNVDAYNENELTIAYIDRAKLLEVPLIVNINDYGVIRMNLSFSLNYKGYIEESTMFNLPLSVDHVDGNFPQTSYISTGLQTKNDTPFFNFQLGQNHLSVGRTQTGSVFLSDSLYGANYAQMSFFTENIRYSNTPIQLEAEKYLYLHRIEFRIFDRIAIGLLEGVLISKPFELRYLNPASIFHNLISWANYTECSYTKNEQTGEYECSNELAFDSHSTAYFGATFDINPWKYMRLYGLLAMNQFTFDFELKDGNLENSFAPGFGTQLGLESFVPFIHGYIHAGIEGVYNVPWLYKSKESNLSPSLYNSTVLINSQGRDWIHTWVGYPYGPDTISAYLQLGYVNFNMWSVYIDYRYMINGEISFSTPYPTTSESITETTPYGVAMSEHRVGIRGSYRFIDWLETEASIAYTMSKNAQNKVNNTQKGLEVSLGARFELSPYIY